MKYKGYYLFSSRRSKQGWSQLHWVNWLNYGSQYGNKQALPYSSHTADIFKVRPTTKNRPMACVPLRLERQLSRFLESPNILNFNSYKSAGIISNYKSIINREEVDQEEVDITTGCFSLYSDRYGYGSTGIR